jgi:hypothetical protein
MSDLTNKNVSQAKIEERKDSTTNREPKKSIPNPQSQNFNSSSNSDTRRKKFQPRRSRRNRRRIRKHRFKR